MLQGRMWNVTGWGPRLCAVGERTAVEVMKHREGERERFPSRRLSPLPRPRLCPSLPGLWPPGGAERGAGSQTHWSPARAPVLSRPANTRGLPRPRRPPRLHRGRTRCGLQGGDSGGTRASLRVSHVS